MKWDDKTYLTNKPKKSRTTVVPDFNQINASNNTSSSTNFGYGYHSDIVYMDEDYPMPMPTDNRVTYNPSTGEVDVHKQNLMGLSENAYEAFDKHLKGIGISARTFGGFLKIYRDFFGGGIQSMLITKKGGKDEERGTN